MPAKDDEAGSRGGAEQDTVQEEDRDRWAGPGEEGEGIFLFKPFVSIFDPSPLVVFSYDLIKIKLVKVWCFEINRRKSK